MRATNEGGEISNYAKYISEGRMHGVGRAGFWAGNAPTEWKSQVGDAKERRSNLKNENVIRERRGKRVRGRGSVGCARRLLMLIVLSQLSSFETEQVLKEEDNKTGD